jgi:hypothetical protein
VEYCFHSAKASVWAFDSRAGFWALRRFVTRMLHGRKVFSGAAKRNKGRQIPEFRSFLSKVFAVDVQAVELLGKRRETI